MNDTQVSPIEVDGYCRGWGNSRENDFRFKEMKFVPDSMIVCRV